MPSKTVPNTPDYYTIAWIAVLPIEVAAAVAMLDEEHGMPRGFRRHSGDDNYYHWGRMGEHNIVIVLSPAEIYGGLSAETVASSLVASLPSIRIGLIVGIGGGVARPDKNRDIRLGDVVVSQPRGTTGGVCQYDLCSIEGVITAKPRTFLAAPPTVLLNALGAIQRSHERKPSKMPSFLQKMLNENPEMAKSTQSEPSYGYQGAGNDRLFISSSMHIGGRDCEGCDASKEIERNERESTDPRVHYGMIASRLIVVKDAAARDRIAGVLGEDCLCLDMAAGSLMKNFPCVVVRGICDYADSHRNARWGRYASATAAAYAKELLTYVPPSEVHETKMALKILESAQEDVLVAQQGVYRLPPDKQLDRIRGWLSPADPSINFLDALNTKENGTCSWFLDGSTFSDWKSDANGRLLIIGPPGCGKTVLASTIVANLRLQDHFPTITLYFFFDFRSKEKQTVDQLLRSLAVQLYTQANSSRFILDSAFESFGSSQMSTEQLSAIVKDMMWASKDKIYVVLDALDECNSPRELKAWLEHCSPQFVPVISFVVTGRPEVELRSLFAGWVKEDLKDVQDPHIRCDIQSFIRSKLDGGDFPILQLRPGLRQEIEHQLLERADSTFRLAALDLSRLTTCLDEFEIREFLYTTPPKIFGRGTLAFSIHNDAESSSSIPNNHLSTSSVAYAPESVTYLTSLTSHNSRLKIDGSIAGPDNDDMSIYTSQDIDEQSHLKYIESFVDVLFSQCSDALLNRDVVERLCVVLPNILRGFALGLGAEKKEDLAHRKAMTFIARLRRDIVKKFRDQYDERRIHLQLKSDDAMQPKDKVQGWLGGDNSQPGIPPSPLGTLHGLDPDLQAEIVEDDMVSLSNDSNDTDQDEDELVGYRRVITASAAYQWLLGRLARELTQTRPTHGISDAIWEKLNLQADIRLVSRRRGPPVCTVTFEASDWDPLAFVKEQEYCVKAGEVIDRAIVINAGPDGLCEYEAPTSGEYIRRTWPVVGEAFVKLVQHLVSEKPGTECVAYLYDRTRLTATLRPPNCSLEAVGTPGTVVEAGEMFAWITTALRAGIEEEITHLSPLVKSVVDGPKGSSIAFTIGVVPYKEPQLHEETPKGQCWRGIFRNPVVVHGFSVSRRPEQAGALPGLEIPLGTMATLLTTKRLSILDQIILLKGYCMALVPTKTVRHGGEVIVVWHVIFNDDGDRISFADPRVRQAYLDHQELDIAEIETARHVIGWCEKVKNHIGSKDANYKIESTSLDPPGAGFIFDRITITAGKYITLAVSGIPGKKDKIIRSARERDYYEQLLWAQERYVVLFDVEERRAWLLDGLSVLLHLVRASLEYSRSRGIPILIGTAKGEHKLKEATDNRSGVAAARQIFGFDENQKLPLYHTPFKETTEVTITTEAGGKPVEKTVVKRERKTVGFPDRVEEVYHRLSLIFDHQWDTGPDGVAVKMRFSPRRRLEGFDFADLAACSEQILPKFLDLKTTGKGWVDFVRAPTVRAVTLFGSGFGDLLESATSCMELPMLPPDPVPLDSEMAGPSSRTPLSTSTPQPPPAVAQEHTLAVADAPTRKIDKGKGRMQDIPPPQPVQCSRHWKTLARNKDLLAVTTGLLKQIAKGRDEKGQERWEAVPGLYWLDPSGDIFKDSECSGAGEGLGVAASYDHTQVFLPIHRSRLASHRLRSPDRVPDDGAVVFGHSGLLKLYWPDAPEMTVTVRDQEQPATGGESGVELSENDRQPATIKSGDSSSSTTTSRLSRVFSSLRPNLGSASGTRASSSTSIPPSSTDRTKRGFAKLLGKQDDR